MAESWALAHDSLTLDVSGAQGKQYGVGMWNPAQITSVEGAELVPAKSGAEKTTIKVQIPANATELYGRERIIIHFTGKTH
jgi:hypothetical protein